MEKLVGEIRNGAGRFATLAVKNLLDRSVSRSSGLLKRYRENGIGDGESRGAAEERRRRVVLIKRQRRKKKVEHLFEATCSVSRHADIHSTALQLRHLTYGFNYSARATGARRRIRSN